MSLISQAVADHNLLDRLGGSSALTGSMGGPCVGSKYHSPTPLTTVQVYLSQVVAEQAQGITLDSRSGEEPVWMCRNCRDNLRVYVLLMAATQGGLDWVVRREFGNRIRDLGQHAWAYYKEAANA